MRLLLIALAIIATWIAWFGGQALLRRHRYRWIPLVIFVWAVIIAVISVVRKMYYI